MSNNPERVPTPADDARLYRMPARARYHQDVEFHQLVDTMQAMIERSQFSPSELREAAVLAATMYEERQARAVYMRRDEDGSVHVAGYPGVRASFCKNCSNYPCTCPKPVRIEDPGPSRYDAEPTETEE